MQREKLQVVDDGAENFVRIRRYCDIRIELVSRTLTKHSSQSEGEIFMTFFWSPFTQHLSKFQLPRTIR